jgi:hypothetical protein
MGPILFMNFYNEPIFTNSVSPDTDWDLVFYNVWEANYLWASIA